VQNSKGGGLASNFQSSGQVMGVRKTTDFLEKATWTMAIALLVLSIMGSAFIPRSQEGTDESMVREQIETAVDPTQVPNFPTSVPEATEETPASANDEGGN
jgi:preprotein translocase subunit SecG